MKAQNTTKIAKKTVFVYKNIKAKNNFSTITGDQSHTIVMTSFIDVI